MDAGILKQLKPLLLLKHLNPLLLLGLFPLPLLLLSFRLLFCFDPLLLSEFGFPFLLPLLRRLSLLLQFFLHPFFLSLSFLLHFFSFQLFLHSNSLFFLFPFLLFFLLDDCLFLLPFYLSHPHHLLLFLLEESFLGVFSFFFGFLFLPLFLHLALLCGTQAFLAGLFLDGRLFLCFLLYLLLQLCLALFFERGLALGAEPSSITLWLLVGDAQFLAVPLQTLFQVERPRAVVAADEVAAVLTGVAVVSILNLFPL